MLGQLVTNFEGKRDKPGLTYFLLKNKHHMAKRFKHKEEIWKMFLRRKCRENVYIHEIEKAFLKQDTEPETLNTNDDKFNDMKSLQIFSTENTPENSKGKWKLENTFTTRMTKKELNFIRYKEPFQVFLLKNI